MTLVTLQKITTLPVDMAGKHRVLIQLDDGEITMFKFSVIPTLVIAQEVVTNYETWKAALPALQEAETVARIRREMEEHGIIELVEE